MRMPSVEVHPSVYDELEHSRSWYEERADHLGVEFLAEVDSAINAIRQMPTIWPFSDEHHDTRRYLVHRFPYGVLYRIREDIIQVIAVMHLRRHPDYWRGRVENWNKETFAQC